MSTLALIGNAGFLLLGVAGLFWALLLVDALLARFEREDEP